MSVALALVALAVAPTAAHAGRMTITKNKTLTGNYRGQIRFGADNITLDCAGHKIRFSLVNTDGCGTTGTARCGIHAVNRSGITIKNCEVTGAFDYGVWIDTTISSVVDHVVARGNDIGFGIDDADQLTVRYSTAITCSNSGFEITDSSNLTLFADSAVSNERDGFDIGDSSAVNIQQAQVLDNAVNGIEFDDSNLATVGSSTVRLNGQHGISLDDSDDFSISSNLVEFNTEDGIRLQNDDDGFIRNNTSQYNGPCSANQDNVSTGNTWTGNLLQTWCDTVPDVH
jgi:parallel beta-helix repeat protein